MSKHTPIWKSDEASSKLLMQFAQEASKEFIEAELKKLGLLNVADDIAAQNLAVPDVNGARVSVAEIESLPKEAIEELLKTHGINVDEADAAVSETLIRYDVALAEPAADSNSESIADATENVLQVDNTSADQVVEKQLGTVHIIDDDAVFRTKAVRMLKLAGINAVGYRSGREYLIKQLRWQSKVPGCILGSESKIEIVRKAHSGKSPMPVVLIMDSHEIVASVDVLKCGAVGFLVKPVSASRLVPAARSALKVAADRRDAARNLTEDQRVFGSVVTVLMRYEAGVFSSSEIDGIRKRFATLKRVERLVFDGLVNEKPSWQLARKLGICEAMVEMWKLSVMEKLEVRTIGDLIRIHRLLRDSMKVRKRKVRTGRIPGPTQHLHPPRRTDSASGLSRTEISDETGLTRGIGPRRLS